MKRVFVFSFLGLISVIPSSYGWGTNYNIATVQYVKEQTLSREQLLPTGVTLVNSNQANDHVPSVKRMEEEIDNAVANKVDKTAVISSTGTVTSDDTQIPTVKRMENAISEATANIDMSTKVDKTSVVSSTGTVTSDDTQIPTIKRMESEIEDALGWVEDTVVAIDQGVEKKDQILVTDSVGAVKTVPQIGMEQVADLEGALNSKIDDDRILSGTTVTAGGITGSLASYTVGIQAANMAHENEVLASSVPTVKVVTETFVPNQAREVNDDYHSYTTSGSGDIRPGLYAIMVNVTEGGQKEYIWQAVQYNTEVTSTGGTQSPL